MIDENKPNWIHIERTGLYIESRFATVFGVGTLMIVGCSDSHIVLNFSYLYHVFMTQEFIKCCHIYTWIVRPSKGTHKLNTAANATWIVIHSNDKDESNIDVNDTSSGH